MEEVGSSSTTQKQSLFNSSIAKLMRLDELWKSTHAHSRAGMFQKWNADLDRIFAELSEDAKEEDNKIFWEFFTKTSKSLTANELYVILLKKEFFIRKLQNKQGLGNAYKESEESYMSD
jgi:hypothetical protein